MVYEAQAFCAATPGDEERRQPLFRVRVLAEFAQRRTRNPVQLKYLGRPERDRLGQVALFANASVTFVARVEGRSRGIDRCNECSRSLHCRNSGAGGRRNRATRGAGFCGGGIANAPFLPCWSIKLVSGIRLAIYLGADGLRAAAILEHAWNTSPFSV